MIQLRKYWRRSNLLVLVVLFGSLTDSSMCGEDAVTVVEITPKLIMFGTSGGNVVASVGSDGALLVGTPSVASTPGIMKVLASRTKSAARYLVVGPQDAAHSEGDAGWGQHGAFVAMQENALRRLGGDTMGAPTVLPRRFVDLGVELPRIAFSEVLTFDLNGDAIHVVHQAPGYSDADTIVHFHVSNLVYLGEVFPGDGYPSIDFAQGGKLSGLLRTLEAWTDNGIRVVPARGKVMNGSDVREFRDMILAVRDRLKRLLDAGESESKILALHPTAEFDMRWGHGRVSPDAFVHSIYRALKEP